MFWPGSTASANRRHSVRNFPAILEGARTSCRGPPKFRRFVRTSQTHTFLKNDSLKKRRISEKYKSSVREIPDLGCADFQRARATTPPVRNRLRMPTARHNRERALLRDELVSVHRRRKIRHRRRETSSSRRSARSRLWPAVGILSRLLTGGVVARALWKSAHPR